MSEVEAEQIFSSKQVAQLLDVSGGMLRRYALAFEQMTGERIPQDPRDGRRFSRRHVETLTAARRFVMGNKGSSVEDGLRRALGMTYEEPPAASSPRSSLGTSIDTVEAFSEALRRYGEPLLTELRTLRESNVRLADEVEALRHDVSEISKTLPESTVITTNRHNIIKDEGMLVRIAKRIEQLWKGSQ